MCDIPGGPGAVCQLGRLGSQAASDVASSSFDKLVDAFVASLADILQWALTWWLDIPSPSLATPSGEPGALMGSIRDYTSGLQVLLLSGGIMFAAARLALAKRGGLAGEAQESFMMFAKAVFASAMFAGVVAAGTRAGDEFSHWVLYDVTEADAPGVIARLAGFDLRHGTSFGSGLLLILALLGIVSALVQLVMLVVRQALLILVVAAIPIAAAASGMGPGAQAYKKMLAWALAFVLWKPVGALVYAIAFTAAGAPSPGQQQDPQLILLGLLLLVMVPITLPALMRLIAPAVAALGGGGGGAAALAGGGLGMAMASTGGRGGSQARKMGEGESSPGGGGPPPPPSGSAGGRPMPSGGGTNRGGGNGASSPGVISGGAAHRAPDGSASKAASSKQAATGAAAGGGGHAAAGAAGPAGAILSVAQLAKQGAQQGISAVDSTVAGSADSFDLHAPVPGEVRR
ncbi:hypothetical protein [Nocardia sp. XZ_19_385]|uniref:hypothetical protein n=1 Tax=Nocardia sp. XZ_19_385 TaxID=2769488 RepID=UPI00188F4758|nr:hypothetical protein [Nocardia sp. XZ_19_385]